MTTINWPGTLPQELLETSYAESMQDNLIRDQFDVGPVGVRPRTTAQPFRVKGVMEMTTAQWVILKAFVTTDLLNRSLAFGFPEQGASPVGTWLVRLVEAPTRQPMLPNWQVTLSIEVLP